MVDPMLKRIIITACLFFVPAAALAQDTGSGSAVAAEGSGSALAAPTPAPHDQLADPTADPRATISDLQDAKKKGWFPLVLVAMYALVRVAGKVGKKISFLHALDAGRPAMIIAGATVVLAACVDSVAAGGNPMNIAVAAGIALVGFLSSAPKAT